MATEARVYNASGDRTSDPATFAFWDPVLQKSFVLELDSTNPLIPVNAVVTVPPLQYTRNAVTTTVTRDTATPANNRPLPVELLAGDALAAIAVGAGNSSATTLRVVVATDQAALPVTGPLTNAQLRATSVPVSAQDGNGNILPSATVGAGISGRALSTNSVLYGLNIDSGAVEAINTVGQSLSVYPLSGNVVQNLVADGGTINTSTSPEPGNTATVGIVIAAGSGGTIIPEVSTNGSTYLTLPVVQIGTASLGVTSAITNTGLYRADITGFKYFRLRLSGTPSVNWAVTLRTTSMPSSSRVIASVSDSVLPVGSSTAALQTTGNTSVASLDTKAVQQALNYGAAAGAVRVACQPGNAAGVADFALGTTGAQTLRVVANNALNGVAALANYGTPTTGSQNIAAMLGVGSTAVSATNPVPVSSGNGSAAVQLVSASQRPYFQDFASGSLTTTYTQVIASTPGVINSFCATNNTSEAIFIATGAAASEVVQYILMPGENAMNVKLQMATATRISIRAAVNTLTSGQFSLNVFA